MDAFANTYGAREAADLTETSYSTLVCAAAKGRISAAKIGWRWVFVESDLIWRLCTCGGLPEPRETLGLHECAALLKIHPNSATKLAKLGMIPGAKIGRSWVFHRKDVMSFLTTEVKRQTEERVRAAAPPQPHGFYRRTRGGKLIPLPYLPPLPDEVAVKSKRRR
ncbi:helix-turn-helix domain-containing protein [Pandoraea communis]|uniref:helix-turn-helix domain-containing protein n=1 Tax=Pandoraea communis TaxID=2508297 RepID=UPI00123EFCC8